MTVRTVIAKVADIPAGEARSFTVGDQEVAVFNRSVARQAEYAIFHIHVDIVPVDAWQVCPQHEALLFLDDVDCRYPVRHRIFGVIRAGIAKSSTGQVAEIAVQQVYQGPGLVLCNSHVMFLQGD